MARAGLNKEESFSYVLLQTILASSVILLSTIVLTGWIANIVVLAQAQSEMAAMVPSTAMLLALCALTVLVGRGKPLQRVKFVSSFLLSAVIIIAWLDQILYFGFGGSGIDALLFNGREDSIFHHMSAMTALGFTLFVVAKTLATTTSKTLRGAFQYVSSAGLLISSVGFIGHAFDAEALYNVSIFHAMSLSTLICFLLLFTALLVQHKELSWMGILLGPGRGSQNARRMGLPILFLPVILCFAALKLSDAGILNVNFRLSLIAILTTLALLSGLLLLAQSQNVFERAQERILTELRQTVNDRNLLLSEVYHRVKNNLQQINALLFIQTQSLKHEEAVNALNAMSGRIESLGIVQSLLLESPTRTHLNLREFLTELCTRLERGLGGALSHTRIKSHVEDQQVGLDQAITLGLIVNELVSNAFKYAFDGAVLDADNMGIIDVEFRTAGEVAILSVSDNGKGLTEGATTLPYGGSGSSIVTALSGQLEGAIDVKSDRGLSIFITIPRSSLGEGE